MAIGAIGTSFLGNLPNLMLIYARLIRFGFPLSWETTRMWISWSLLMDALDILYVEAIGEAMSILISSGSKRHSFPAIR